MHNPLSRDGTRVVLCHGVFDLLHLGHIRHLQEARAQGERLIVSVTPDEHVRKGVGRPVFTAVQRVEALKALDCVDDAFVNDGADAVSAIARIKPAVYVKGVDYGGREDARLEREIAAVTALGGRFHVTSSEKWSSSRIINGERLSEDALRYLDYARNNDFLDQIRAAFEHADQLRIAFVGETIIDEYRYVSPLGRPPKECIISTVESRECETFAGGVTAASRQAEWPNATVVTREESPIRKTRFVDPAYTRKLFEVYSEREIELTAVERAAWQIRLEEEIDRADAVIVLDFGHGLLGPAERHSLERAKFLAVNAQSNSANFGFNPVTKFYRADYVCIDEPEARLAVANQSDPLPWVLRELSRRILCAQFIVTRGRSGCTLHAPEPALSPDVPAFVQTGVDTMGAGDAFMAATAPLVAAGLDLEPAALVGNVAGALKLGIVGHRSHVSRADLIDTIEALLK